MDVNQITKITICQELFETGIPKSHIAEKLQINRETVRTWIRGAQESFGRLRTNAWWNGRLLTSFNFL
jgi:transposase-like protein